MKTTKSLSNLIPDIWVSIYVLESSRLSSWHKRYFPRQIDLYTIFDVSHSDINAICNYINVTQDNSAAALLFERKTEKRQQSSQSCKDEIAELFTKKWNKNTQKILLDVCQSQPLEREYLQEKDTPIYILWNFCMIWKFMLITASSICIILHTILRLIQ